MHCPVCGGEETKVVDSRTAPDGTMIRRRRSCDGCGHRFSTLEEVELLDICVVKRNGMRESYRRDKVEVGLKRALHKREHTDADFRSLIYGIERDIQRIGAQEITSAQVGEIVLHRLKAFDQVAYIRFASVYRSFDDVESFTDALKSLT